MADQITDPPTGGTVIDLGKKVKAKYPQYANLSDEEVGRKVKAKYPDAYGSFADVPSFPKPLQPMTTPAPGAAEGGSSGGLATPQAAQPPIGAAPAPTGAQATPSEDGRAGMPESVQSIRLDEAGDVMVDMPEEFLTPSQRQETTRTLMNHPDPSVRQAANSRLNADREVRKKMDRIFAQKQEDRKLVDQQVSGDLQFSLQPQEVPSLLPEGQGPATALIDPRDQKVRGDYMKSLSPEEIAYKTSKKEQGAWTDRDAFDEDVSSLAHAMNVLDARERRLLRKSEFRKAQQQTDALGDVMYQDNDDVMAEAKDIDLGREYVMGRLATAVQRHPEYAREEIARRIKTLDADVAAKENPMAYNVVQPIRFAIDKFATSLLTTPRTFGSAEYGLTDQMAEWAERSMEDIRAEEPTAFRGGMLEDGAVHPERIMPKVVETLGQAALLMGTSPTRPALLASAFVQSNGDYYNEARRSKMTHAQAQKFAWGAAALTSALEMASPNDAARQMVSGTLRREILDGLEQGLTTKQILARASRVAAKEALPEMGQEGGQYLGDKGAAYLANRILGADKLDDQVRFSEFTENAVLGGVVGGLAGGAPEAIRLASISETAANPQKVAQAAEAMGDEKAAEKVQRIVSVYDGNDLSTAPPEKAAKVADVIMQKGDIEKKIKEAPMDPALEAATGDPRKKEVARLTTEMIEAMGIPQEKAKAALAGTGLEKAPEGTKVVTNPDGSVTLEKKPEATGKKKPTAAPAESSEVDVPVSTEAAIDEEALKQAKTLLGEPEEEVTDTQDEERTTTEAPGTEAPTDTGVAASVPPAPEPAPAGEVENAEGRDLWRMTRGEVGDIARAAHPPPVRTAQHETLKAISDKASRKGYDPEALTPERLAPLREAKLISRSETNPKLTDEGNAALRQMDRDFRDEDLSVASASDKAVDAALDEHRAAIDAAIAAGENVPARVLEEYGITPASLQAPAENIPVSKPEKAMSSASRFRPRKRVEFDTPIKGPSGAVLKAYEWQYEFEEYIDDRGEERVRRVSDWNKAELSDETGRDIVHQFEVVTPDGLGYLVSAESALKLMGYMEANASVKSKMSAAKALAGLLMNRQVLQEEVARRKAVEDEVDALPRPEIIKEDKSENEELRGFGREESKNRINQVWSMGDASISASFRKDDPYLKMEKEERAKSLVRSWKENRLKERGVKPYENPSAKLREVEKKIATKERQLGAKATDVSQAPAQAEAPLSKKKKDETTRTTSVPEVQSNATVPVASTPVEARTVDSITEVSRDNDKKPTQVEYKVPGWEDKTTVVRKVQGGWTGFIIDNGYDVRIQPEGKSQPTAKLAISDTAERLNRHGREKVQALLDSRTQEQRTEGQGIGEPLKAHIDNVVKALKRFVPGINVVVHDTPESFVAASKAAGGSAVSSVAGLYDPATNTIHINRVSADSNTLWHEAAHPVLAAALKAQPELLEKFYRELATDPKFKRYVEFGEQYQDEGDLMVAVEAIVEFMADVADGKIPISKDPKSLYQKFKAWLTELLTKMGFDVKRINLGDPKSLRDFASKFATAVREGIAISGLPKTGGSAIMEQRPKSIPVATWNAMLPAMEQALAAGQTAQEVYDGLDKTNLNEQQQADLKARVDEVHAGMQAWRDSQKKAEPEAQGAREVKKTFTTKRAYEGEFRDEVKAELEKSGLYRDIESQEEAEARADAFIASVGMDAALEAVRAGDVRGGTRSVIRVRAAEALEKEFLQTTDPARLAEITKQQSELIQETSSALLEGGREASMMARMYANSDLGFNSEVKASEWKREFGTDPSPEMVAKWKERDKEFAILKKRLAELEKKTADTRQAQDAEIKDLTQKRDKAQEEYRQLQSGGGDKGRLEAAKKLVKKTIEDLERRLRERDFSKQQRKSTEADKELMDLKVRRQKLRDEYDIEFEKERLRNRTIREKVYDTLMDLVGVPKSLLSSVDFSAPMRQGLILSAGNPRAAGRATAEMFRQAFSQGKADYWIDHLKQTEAYRLMKQSGLYIAEPNAKITAKEENFVSNIAERIPVLGPLVRGSNRAYSGYLNKLRADVFMYGANEMMAQGLTPESNPNEYREWAKFINNATGRGELYQSIESAAPLLNNIFFSPRYIASRFNLLNPVKYIRMPKETRKMAMRNMISFVGFYALIAAILRAAGADEEEDPRDTDFGKFTFGNTRYDMLAGFAQPIRLLARLITGQTSKDDVVRDLDGNRFPFQTRGDVLLDFARTKLSPTAGVVADLMTGEDMVGNPATWDRELVKLTVPLYLQDIKAAYEDGGPTGVIASAVPALFGIGVQTYGKNESGGQRRGRSERRPRRASN